MSDEPIKMDAGDVKVEELDNVICGDCAEAVATHFVSVDFRTAGMIRQIGGEYCKPCADELADRIREGLPPDARNNQ